MERCLVQILVEVATIQVKPLKTEVEKGSVRTAIGHGLVAPKPKANALQRGVVPFEALPPCVRKGI